MRIVAVGIKARETTLAGAVSIVVDGDPDGTRDMLVRLLEELTNEHGEEGALLRPKQLARILAYKFDVLEE